LPQKITQKVAVQRRKLSDTTKLKFTLVRYDQIPPFIAVRAGGFTDIEQAAVVTDPLNARLLRCARTIFFNLSNHKVKGMPVRDI
jgi:hypothetical protein